MDELIVGDQFQAGEGDRELNILREPTAGWLPLRPRASILGTLKIVLAAAVLFLNADVEAGQHLAPPPSFAPGDQAFIIFAGAGFRLPLEEAARVFGDRNGLEIEASFAGSGCLLAQAELLGRGDVFVPGEEIYVDQARSRGLVGATARLAFLEPVIAVPKGNPQGIVRLSDLARPGLRLGLGDPSSVAVGLAAERWIDDGLSSPMAAGVRANVRTRALNVNELGSQLALDALDAAVVWNATLPLFAALEAAPVEGGWDHRTVIVGATLNFARHPGEARAFLDFLSGPEGRAIFERHGYQAWRAEDDPGRSAAVTR
ncbi:MAG: substrate-binding domain-containing protein [Candidatus Eisenbacteria bacterium]|nr:substrate-binding domain-containing protein [Candidatus Eisenbacteria bacterium]